MKGYFVILLLILGANALAQPPRIDSMRVDEWRRELAIYGDFGDALGVVRCDTVPLLVKTWTATTIVVSIPDTGRGSCGPVVVGARGYSSPARVLGELRGYWSGGLNQVMTSNHQYWGVVGQQAVAFAIRLDPFSLGMQEVVAEAIPNASLSNFQVQFHGGKYDGNGTGTEFVSGVTGSPILLPLVRPDSTPQSGCHISCALTSSHDALKLRVSGISGAWARYTKYVRAIPTVDTVFTVVLSDISFIVPLDTDLSVLNTTNRFDSVYGGAISTTSSGYFFGRDTLYALRSIPQLLFPRNNTDTVVNDTIQLRWKRLPLIRSYLLQYYLDSSFSTGVTNIETIDTSYSFQGDTIYASYYWRVAGKNAEGQTGWSPTWNFRSRSIFDFAPILISPKIDTFFTNPGPVVLKWHPLKFMTGYIIQYAFDSAAFGNKQIATLGDTEISISNLDAATEYFWHVAGTNSEGQSRWSEAWHFWAYDPASVDEKHESPTTFTCTPNPATNVLNITLPAPARVVLYDLRGNIVRSITASEPSLRIETKDIASGTYIVGVFANGTRQSQIVSIVH
jgi:hypothetical protein